MTPTTALEYLDHVVDSEKLAFLIPKRKIKSFAALREDILASKSWVDFKTLQRFQEKCISFSLAVPSAKLFIREISSVITSALENGTNKFLTEELSYWRFLDDWDRFLPWKEEKNRTVSLSTDASGHGWGCVLHCPSGVQSFGDYWTPDEMELFISSKEMLALVHAVRALPQGVRDCRFDAYVDSQVLIGAWDSQGSKISPQLTKVTKQLFFILSSRNIQLNLSYLPSQENLADAPSRKLSPLILKYRPRL